MSNSNSIIYFDYAATTPVDPRVIEKMQHYLGMDGIFANPASNTHLLGLQAAKAIAVAREQVANSINAHAKEIIFTSGATEADNLALKGVAQFYQKKGKHIITLMTEHKAVLDTCHSLEKQGFRVSYLRPQKNGLLNLQDLASAICDDTILISIMQVNNETGVIQDIQKFAELAKSKGIFFHTDAAQSIGKIVLDVTQTPVDLVSICGHKIYAPKGIGALYVRRKPRIRLTEQINGGQHEYGMRSGTLATHQIIALGEALKIAKTSMDNEYNRIKKLSEQLWQRLSVLSDIKRNGDNCLPHILNITFHGVDNEALMASCQKLAFSAGSACTSTTIEASHVLQAMGINNALANNTIRISLGRFTDEKQIEVAADDLIRHVNRLRAMSPL